MTVHESGPGRFAGKQFRDAIMSTVSDTEARDILRAVRPDSELFTGSDEASWTPRQVLLFAALGLEGGIAHRVREYLLLRNEIRKVSWE